MLKLNKRDLFTIAGVVILLVLLIFAGTRNKATAVPADEKHLAFFVAIKEGQDRISVDTRCTSCHNNQKQPLPVKHLPKEQCLICHKLK